MASSEHGNPSYLQGNSLTSKERQAKAEKHVEKVVTAGVKHKQPLMRRALASDPGDIRNRVVGDVVIPAVKEMVRKGFMTVLDLALYGEVRGDSRKPGGMRTPYNSMYERDGRPSGRRPMARQAFNFDDIVFDDRDDAQAVLDNLVDYTVEYGMSSVADFYELCGLPTQHTDNKYGWEDLRGANVMLVRDGYIVNLPKPVLLEG